MGFSIDKGATFRVVTSYEGDCPKRYNGWTDPANQTFPFTVPADLPAGDAIFAWSWDNREQEFFMNCAAVTITNGNTPSTNPESATSVAATPSPTSTASPSSQTYTLGDCSCTCGSTSQSGTEYVLSDCCCTCPTAPPSSYKLKPRWLRAGKRSAAAEPISLTLDDHTCTCAAQDDAAQQRVSYSGCECRAPADSAAAKAKRQSPAGPSVAFNDRPLMFVADIDNGCETPHTTAELQYPNPGPDVVMGDGVYPLEPPTGNCS